MGKTLQPGVPWLNSRLEACNGPEAENSQKKVSQWFPGVNKKLGLEAEIKRKANVCYGFEQAEALWIRSTKWKRQSCTGRRVEVIWRDFLNTEVVEWFQLTLINWWLLFRELCWEQFWDTVWCVHESVPRLIHCVCHGCLGWVGLAACVPCGCHLWPSWWRGG